MNDIAKSWVEREILCTQEVAALMGCSRQYINTLVQRKKITPIKSIPGNSLFLRSEIEEYIESKQKSNHSNYPKVISTGSSEKTRKLLDEIIPDKSKIDSINLYFYGLDAIGDKYYAFEDLEKHDRIMRVTTPTCVIKVKNYEDVETYMFRDFLPGYAGTSPTYTHKMLVEFGIPKEIADEIFEARWIEIYKLGDSWNYNVEYRFTEEEREIWTETQNGNTPKYMYNKSFVVFDENILINRLHNDPLNFVNKHLKFIDSPESISIYNREKAIETGHYVYGNLGAQLYNVVIKGTNDNEIWLYCPINEEKAIGNQIFLNELFEMFDIRFSKLDCAVDKVRRIFGKAYPVYRYGIPGRAKRND